LSRAQGWLRDHPSIQPGTRSGTSACPSLEPEFDRITVEAINDRADGVLQIYRLAAARS
jgi:hypothetical protein